MKLHGMAGGLQEQMKNRAYKELSFEERLGMLVDREMDSRQDRKLKNTSYKGAIPLSGGKC